MTYQAIGCDIIQIPRIEALLESAGEKFIERVFTSSERQSAEKKKHNTRLYAAHFAKRFAAKEAFAKALGTGFGQSLAMHSLGIINNSSGAPEFELSTQAKKAVEAKFGHSYEIDVSLSDDYPQALAFVIIRQAI
jgi:holo-[acyl-carrier protein] synthase